MDYLKKEYCCFSADDTFLIPECMRPFSRFADREQYISITATDQAITLSADTAIPYGECLALVDRHGRVEVPKRIRLAAGITSDNFIAYLIDPVTMLLTALSFLIRRQPRPWRGLAIA